MTPDDITTCVCTPGDNQYQYVFLFLGGNIIWRDILQQQWWKLPSSLCVRVLQSGTRRWFFFSSWVGLKWLVKEHLLCIWESQVLLMDGKVVFPWVLRFSPTFDEWSARYMWNILERAVKPKLKKKKILLNLFPSVYLPDTHSYLDLYYWYLMVIQF